MQLYPAFLNESIFELRDQLTMLAPVMDQIETVQVDIIDGEFVDNLTISPIDLLGTDFGSLAVDFHLMTNDPINFVYECKQIDNARAVIGQVEHMDSQALFLSEIKEYDLKAGLSLNVFTPIEAIDDDSWQDLTVIQVMGIEAGFQGQEFKGEQVLHKIREIVRLKNKMDLPNLEIIVDGGVKLGNIDSILHAGATGVSVGSALWTSKDLEKTVSQLTM